MPHSDDGTRIEPLVSEPSASGTKPPPTAAPEPPEEPPVMRVEIVRIVRGAVVDVLAGEIVGIFAHVERADEHGAGRFQPLDQRRVACRRRQLAIDLGTGKRRQAGDVEQILHRERYAGERPELFALRLRRIERTRTRERALLGDGGEGIEQRIVFANAGERGVDDAFGADAASADGGSNSGRRAPGEIVARHFKHGIPAPVRRHLAA